MAIPASPEAITPLIVDFHRWLDWSPWEGLDPELQRTYSGPDSGVATKYEWSGNKKAGAGTMEVLSVSDASVDMDLIFTRPFKSNGKTNFALVADGEGTTVTWQVHTPKTLMTKVVGLFMNFDKTVGADLEKGLARMKAVVAKA